MAVVGWSTNGTTESIMNTTILVVFVLSWVVVVVTRVILIKQRNALSITTSCRSLKPSSIKGSNVDVISNASIKGRSFVYSFVPASASVSVFVEEDVLRTSVMCLKNSDLNFQSSLSFKKEICTRKRRKLVQWTWNWKKKILFAYHHGKQMFVGSFTAKKSTQRLNLAQQQLLHAASHSLFNDVVRRFRRCTPFMR